MNIGQDFKLNLDILKDLSILVSAIIFCYFCTTLTARGANSQCRAEGGYVNFYQKEKNVKKRFSLPPLKFDRAERQDLKSRFLILTLFSFYPFFRSPDFKSCLSARSLCRPLNFYF